MTIWEDCNYQVGELVSLGVGWRSNMDQMPVAMFGVVVRRQPSAHGYQYDVYNLATKSVQRFRPLLDHDCQMQKVHDIEGDDTAEGNA